MKLQHIICIQGVMHTKESESKVRCTPLSCTPWQFKSKTEVENLVSHLHSYNSFTCCIPAELLISISVVKPFYFVVVADINHL